MIGIPLIRLVDVVGTWKNLVGCVSTIALVHEVLFTVLRSVQPSIVLFLLDDIQAKICLPHASVPPATAYIAT